MLPYLQIYLHSYKISLVDHQKIKKIFFSELKSKELVWPILGCVSLLIICVITSQQKYLWMDEILSYYPASMPSFSKMISFVNDKINCGLLFISLPYGFGQRCSLPSEVSLRLFSSLCFCVQLMVTWSMLRKVYGTWSATLSTLAVFLGASLILHQNSEARMYGLLLFFCALLSKQTIDLPNDPSFNKRTSHYASAS